MIRGVKGMDLACVLERKTNNAKTRYPEVRIARTLDEMLSDKSINLVVVATPNDTHYSYAKASLEAGRHVVVDKPLTPTMAEAEELVRLAATLRQRETAEVDDAFDVILQYPKLRVTLRARIIAYAPSHHLLVHGTEGSFVKYGMDPQEEILRSPNYPDGLDWGKDWGRETEKHWGTLTRVGESPRKIETEPGDYRGFYANM